ncbi:MAG TPA: sucrase ferredoxin, partial [Actinomycetota bacterium]|nr:sucrase ferredoxin [Actinomycetota bacterium]
MTERFRCSPTSRARGEPRYGTASTVRRWILVEAPSPWGRDAVLDSRLPPGVGPALKALAQALGARVLLIRRHGRSRPAERTCLVARTTLDTTSVERLPFDDPAELLDRDWTPLVHDEPVGGLPVDRPVYLVCTNGRHDPCCAEYGRRLAVALSTAVGDGLWECSHFGGDRFAGNLVCLPHGVYYGHVEPWHGPAVAAAYAEGRIDLEHYRGRSCH